RQRAQPAILERRLDFRTERDDHVAERRPVLAARQGEPPDAAQAIDAAAGVERDPARRKQLQLAPAAPASRIEAGRAAKGIGVVADEDLAGDADRVAPRREVDRAGPALHEDGAAALPAGVAGDADVDQTWIGGFAGGVGDARLHARAA